MSVVVQSEVGIASAASLHLGRDPIVDFDDLDSKTAQIFKERYAATRDRLLRTYPWNFAMRFQNLPGAALSTPVFGWTHEFTLPSGGNAGYCLKLWRAGDATTKFQVQGRKIFAQRGGPLPIQFVHREENPEIFDPIFAELLAVELALVLMNRIPSNETRKRTGDLKKERRTLRRDARLSDALEQSAGQFAQTDGGTWLQARRPA